MMNTTTAPENIRNNQRYWLNANGNAYAVDDHLRAAQYAKADSDEYEKPMPWSYEDMFKRGWVRVQTSSDVIWADNETKQFTGSQRKWLKDAAIFLGAELGTKVRVSNGLGDEKAVIRSEKKEDAPTRRFVEMYISLKKKLGL